MPSYKCTPAGWQLTGLYRYWQFNFPGRSGAYLFLRRVRAIPYFVAHCSFRFESKAFGTGQMKLVPAAAVLHTDEILLARGWVGVQAGLLARATCKAECKFSQLEMYMPAEMIVTN